MTPTKRVTAPLPSPQDDAAHSIFQSRLDQLTGDVEELKGMLKGEGGQIGLMTRIVLLDERLSAHLNLYAKDLEERATLRKQVLAAIVIFVVLNIGPVIIDLYMKYRGGVP